MGGVKEKQERGDGAGGALPTSAVLTAPPPRLAGVALAKNHEATAQVIHRLVVSAAGRFPDGAHAAREVRFATRTGRAYVWPVLGLDGDDVMGADAYITLVKLPYELNAADEGTLGRKAIMAHQHLRDFWGV